MKKFELVPEMSISFLGRKLFRIHALIDFTTKWGETIHAGELGGYVEKEENLSHKGDAWVYNNALVCDDAKVCGSARVYDNALICDNARIYGNARICGNVTVRGDARICGSAEVSGKAKICGNAEVYGDAKVYGNVLVYDNADVYERDHILAIGPIGSRNDTTTFFRDKDNEITVSCGCFFGKIEDFLQKVEETHGENKHGKSYRLAAELAKAQINLR